jgi:phosphoribosylformylglycinamidine synthase
MILFAESKSGIVYAIEIASKTTPETDSKLEWLLDGSLIKSDTLTGYHIGPRKEMVTPWSTNAVEITQNMGIEGIIRIEEFAKGDENSNFDSMLQVLYNGLDQTIYTVENEPEKVEYIDNIKSYNQQEGLALNDEEVGYLAGLSDKLGRKLTDSEVFGFSQVNSEHCRHKIFNGEFTIDGVTKPSSLFKLIRNTTSANPNGVVSAYKDNVAFVKGPMITQFAPKTQNKPDYFETKTVESIISVKAETHNFPTTVEPFNGAATGAGGEIRDRMAGGKASIPLAGTAVYMTPYSRLEKDRKWEDTVAERPWLYQTPMDLLIKASNGASDFGNKFGQPLISGSVLTFEHLENDVKLGFDKVIMLAGGVGTGVRKDALKDTPKKGDKVVIMGGDNYRIGMGGSAVSSVETGVFSNSIELNAIQRSNPEMQKRVYNVVRAMSESDNNSIVSIHDHGAGGHLNCLSELVEETGGKINIDKLPVGDPTLSSKEIIGNESQERMGLVIDEKDIPELQAIAERERAPFYDVGECTGDDRFVFTNKNNGELAIDLGLKDFFGNPPKTLMNDVTVAKNYKEVNYDSNELQTYIEAVLQLESVACKDWLTNKVDRSVTGRVAKQQTCGEVQLPLNDVGVMALDYEGKTGIATSIGHAPISALVDEAAGSRLAIAESLTNIVFAPLTEQIKGVSLSANWMWPCKNKGEDARLYNAVEAVSEFAIGLGINIPTGKDSLSMVQKYKDGEKVYAPGTVIITAAGEVADVRKVVSPNIQNIEGSELIYIDFSSENNFALGGSSFAQILNKLGVTTPDTPSAEYFKTAFNAVQTLIEKDTILAGHDVSAGGLITCLLEMCFPSNDLGLSVDTAALGEADLIKTLFSESPAIVIQVKDAAAAKAQLDKAGAKATIIGNVLQTREFTIAHNGNNQSFDIDALRDTWYKTSYLLDQQQSTEALATERFKNYKTQTLSYNFPESFTGSFSQYGVTPSHLPSGTKAAIIREKGVNGDREMAYSMYLAGFDVKDVHMTDLISGRETLEDVNFIVFVGGFSNSDVLGSAKGWAGAFLYNAKAKAALDNFYARKDTMSLGVCNGCQLMVELGLIYPDADLRPTMEHNSSHKFESGYVNVEIQKTDSIMLKSLEGSKLGIWIAHGEGKFNFPKSEDNYGIGLKYAYSDYPANPNNSQFDTAAISSKNGRHLAMMPHLERAIFPWQCANYPSNKKQDDCTPWLEAFVNAKKWVDSNK